MLLFKLNLLKVKTVFTRKSLAISSSNYRNGLKPYEEIPRVTFLNFLSVSLRPSKRGKLDKVYDVTQWPQLTLLVSDIGRLVQN